MNSTVVQGEVDAANTLSEQKLAVENSTNRSIKQKKVAPSYDKYAVHVNSHNISKKVVVKSMGGAKANATK